MARLRLVIAGQGMVPGDDGDDERRRVWNATVDQRPAVIAGCTGRCTGHGDVAAAVRSGRAHGLEVGMRCGGHSVPGLPVTDGGLLIDLPLGAARVDPDGRPGVGPGRRAPRRRGPA